MIKISIKDAQIGMVAAEPIKTPLGQILALPGTPLTRQLINKMKLLSLIPAIWSGVLMIEWLGIL